MIDIPRLRDAWYGGRVMLGAIVAHAWFLGPLTISALLVTTALLLSALIVEWRRGRAK